MREKGGLARLRAEDHSDAGVFRRQRQRDPPAGRAKVMAVTDAEDRCMNLGSSKGGPAISRDADNDEKRKKVGNSVSCAASLR